MPQHLILFTDSREPSGVGSHMLTLAGQLRGRYRVTLVCPPTEAGRRVLRAAAARGLRAWALDASHDRPGACVALADRLGADGADLVHVHAGIGWEGFGGIMAAHVAGLPVVRTEHLPYLLTDPAQQRNYARHIARVRRVICVSAGVRASFAAAGVPPAQLRVVRNGIALPPEPDGRDPAGDGPPCVVTVGRLTAQKGHGLLLDAVPAVVARVPDVRFIWVGSGPLTESLRAAVAARGLAGHVSLPGRIADPAPLLRQACLFVLPSRFEGLPLVLLEAMAARLPVVATDVCGSSEVVADGVTGRLVPPDDPAALADAICTVLQDRARGRRWGQAGYARLTREFSAARMAAETAAVYDEVLRPRRGAPGVAVALARAAAYWMQEGREGA